MLVEHEAFFSVMTVGARVAVALKTGTLALCRLL